MKELRGRGRKPTFSKIERKVKGKVGAGWRDPKKRERNRKEKLKPFSLKICDALHDLVPFAQFKKREKHPRRNVTFSKVAG